MMSGISAAVGNMVSGKLAAARRSATGYAICVVCAFAILILATTAAVLSLTPVVGAVYALLIVAGIYAVAIAGTLIWLRQPAQPVRAAAAQPAMPAGAAAGAEAMQKQMQMQQLTMIIEAVMLGYSMSRRR